jgi:membrane protein implicated in regulation of membrane protease activity
MNWILAAARELIGLFVDDGSLALGVLAWVAVTVWVFPELPLGGAWLAVALFAGLALILAENLLRATRRRTRP